MNETILFHSKKKENILSFSICETRQQPKWGLGLKCVMKIPDVTLASGGMSSWVTAAGLEAPEKGLTEAKPAPLSFLQQSKQPKVISKEQNFRSILALR